MKKILIILLVALFCSANISAQNTSNDSIIYYFQKGYNAYQIPQYDSAIYYIEKCVKLLSGIDNINQDTLLVNQVLFPIEQIYSRNYNYQKAIELRKDITNIYKQRLGNKSTEYASSLMCLAYYYRNLGEYNEALKTDSLALNIRKEVLGMNNKDYATSLNNLAIDYSNLGNYTEAVKLGTQTMYIYKEALGENSKDYALSLSNLSSYYRKLRNYQETVRYDSLALIIRGNIFGEKNLDYAESLHNLALDYYYLSNYNEAIKYDFQALTIRKEILGEKNKDYANSLYCLALYYDHLGNYSEAINYGTQALNIHKETLGDKHPSYANSLSNLASYYDHLGNYREAIELGTQALNIRKEVLGDKHPDYATSLGNLAGYYDDLGNYSEAINYGTQALNIRKEVLGEKHPDYATSLSNLALYYDYLGNYNEAIELGTQAMNIYKEILGEKHPDYATSLNCIASYYDHLGNYNEVIELGTQAMNIYKEVLGEKHPSYATSLHGLAIYYDHLGNYSEAIKYGTQALNIRKEVLGEKHPDYATSLNNLALYYDYLRNYNEAIKMGTQAVNIRKEVLGDKHPSYATSLGNLAIYYDHLGNYSEAISLCGKYLNLAQDIVLNTFGDLSSNERQLFWEKYKYKFNSYFPQIAHKSGFSNVSSTLYDKSALFAKGLLLGAETEMTKLIQESGDAEALKKYEELRNNRMMLNKLYEKPIAERTINTDSLENLVNVQEKELVEKCKVYGDYTKNLRLTWKDVQAHLGTQDLAVEFLSFPIGNDSTMYIALTLCKNDTAPQMVTLFEQKQISALPDTITFNCPEMTALVWGKMKDQLKGIKNIYFSPSGLLYNTGIEYLPGMEGYNLYRLSSTRELVNRQIYNEQKRAVIFGNINYNSDLSTHKPTLTSTDDYLYASNKGMPDFGYFSKGNVICLGDAELKGVSAALKEAKMPTDIYSADEATEESFKALSGKKISLMHIDTHGFYFPKEEKDVDIIKRFGTEKRTEEDNSLERCGLMFAGANYTLDGDSIPEGVDDGILTAQEIAHIDFRGLDLVTISACVSGLGDISQGEGVFGLQRGFKKAGAHSLVMSLWPADVEATRILMTEFYKQYTSGKTKRSAFQAAQEHLRTIDNGKYNQPKYWAAFILLDAID